MSPPEQDARQHFWEQAQALIQQGPEGLEALHALAWSMREELITAPSPREDDPDWVGGLPSGEGAGPRCFLLPWSPGSKTAIHGHPRAMVMVVFSGQLEVTDYAWEDEQEEHVRRVSHRSIPAGESALAWAEDSGRYDHFMHRIASHEETLSLHLYSDDPGLGVYAEERSENVAAAEDEP